MNFWDMVLRLFLIANPIGVVPVFVALVKDFDAARQRRILLRESIISFLIAVPFIFVGKYFLDALDIESYALSVCGGVLVLIIAIKMIFPDPVTEGGEIVKKEPFIVPIATPMITGGGVLSTIMIIAEQEKNDMNILLAACVAWIAVTIIVVCSSYLNKILGKRGLIAMEQLMGMLLALLAMNIIVGGAQNFMKILQGG